MPNQIEKKLLKLINYEKLLSDSLELEAFVECFSNQIDLLSESEFFLKKEIFQAIEKIDPLKLDFRPFLFNTKEDFFQFRSLLIDQLKKENYQLLVEKIPSLYFFENLFVKKKPIDLSEKSQLRQMKLFLYFLLEEELTLLIIDQEIQEQLDSLLKKRNFFDQEALKVYRCLRRLFFDSEQKDFDFQSQLEKFSLFKRESLKSFFHYAEDSLFTSIDSNFLVDMFFDQPKDSLFLYRPRLISITEGAKHVIYRILDQEYEERNKLLSSSRSRRLRDYFEFLKRERPIVHYYVSLTLMRPDLAIDSDIADEFLALSKEEKKIFFTSVLFSLSISKLLDCFFRANTEMKENFLNLTKTFLNRISLEAVFETLLDQIVYLTQTEQEKMFQIFYDNREKFLENDFYVLLFFSLIENQKLSDSEIQTILKKDVFFQYLESLRRISSKTKSIKLERILFRSERIFSNSKLELEEINFLINRSKTKKERIKIYRELLFKRKNCLDQNREENFLNYFKRVVKKLMVENDPFLIKKEITSLFNSDQKLLAILNEIVVFDLVKEKSKQKLSRAEKRLLSL